MNAAASCATAPRPAQSYARRYYDAPRGPLVAAARAAASWTRLRNVWFTQQQQQQQHEGDSLDEEKGLALQVRRGDVRKDRGYSSCSFVELRPGPRGRSRCLGLNGRDGYTRSLRRAGRIVGFLVIAASKLSFDFCFAVPAGEHHRTPPYQLVQVGRRQSSSFLDRGSSFEQKEISGQ